MLELRVLTPDGVDEVCGLRVAGVDVVCGLRVAGVDGYLADGGTARADSALRGVAGVVSEVARACALAARACALAARALAVSDGGFLAGVDELSIRTWALPRGVPPGRTCCAVVFVPTDTWSFRPAGGPVATGRSGSLNTGGLSSVRPAAGPACSYRGCAACRRSVAGVRTGMRLILAI